MWVLGIELGSSAEEQGLLTLESTLAPRELNFCDVFLPYLNLGQQRGPHHCSPSEAWAGGNLGSAQLLY